MLYAHRGDAARPTLDLDFLGERISRDKESLIKVFRNICSIPCEDCIVFQSDSLEVGDIAIEKKYPGVRLSIIATLGQIMQFVSMDIGFGDIIVPHSIELDYPTLLTEDSIPILAYSVETVVAEKLQTMVDRYVSNSRMKDFFDVWMLLMGNFESHSLYEAITSTFSNRQTSLSEINNVFAKDFYENESLNLRWKAFSRKLNRDLPSFATIMKDIRDKLLESNSIITLKRL